MCSRLGSQNVGPQTRKHRNQNEHYSVAIAWKPIYSKSNDKSSLDDELVSGIDLEANMLDL